MDNFKDTEVSPYKSGDRVRFKNDDRERTKGVVFTVERIAENDLVVINWPDGKWYNSVHPSWLERAPQEAETSTVATEGTMKRAIHIERPDGRIPGLLEANSILAERFGVTVAAVIDMDGENQKWVSCELREAHIENDEIIVGSVIHG